MEIKRELLQEFVLPILKDIRDAEGDYKEKFVRTMLKVARQLPVCTYNPKTFLRQIKKDY